MGNTWKKIPDYNGVYEMNNLGQIRSFHYNTIKILSSSLDSQGYVVFQLRKNGKLKRVRQHRLLCQLFIDNPDNKPCVNHKDGNKQNNSLSNLEWVTYSENTIHSYNNGLQKKIYGDACHNVKIKEADIPVIIDLIKQGFNNKEIAEKYKVNASTISKLRNGKSRQKIQISENNFQTKIKFSHLKDDVVKLIKLGCNDSVIERKTGVPRKSKFLKDLRKDLGMIYAELTQW